MQLLKFTLNKRKNMFCTKFKLLQYAFNHLIFVLAERIIEQNFNKSYSHTHKNENILAHSKSNKTNCVTCACSAFVLVN
jgi:hypothetical protein